jgi:hypothetical protein
VERKLAEMTIAFGQALMFSMLLSIWLRIQNGKD